MESVINSYGYGDGYGCGNGCGCGCNDGSGYICSCGYTAAIAPATATAMAAAPATAMAPGSGYGLRRPGIGWRRMTRRQNIEIIEQMEQAMADIQPGAGQTVQGALWVPIIYGLCRAVWLLAQDSLQRKELTNDHR